MHDSLMQRNYAGKKVFSQTIFTQPPKHIDTNQGVFRKGKNEGYLNMN